MNDVELRANCGQCAALCCVSFSFDKSAQFAIDKAAGSPCPNLGSSGDCTVHEKLAEHGFNGCVQYDCFGAGQHLTQTVFAGRSWQDEPSLLVPMMNGFRAMRQVHDLLVLLNEAGKLSLPAQYRQKLLQLREVLHPVDGWTEKSLDAFEVGPVPGEVRVFLSSLRNSVDRAQISSASSHSG